jgi:mannosyltransferase
MSIVAALSRNEGFGLTIPEAMASGCAVLASHAGAWQDIITEGLHGFTVPVEHLEATQAALERLLKSDLVEMGVAGRNHVEQDYTIQREANSLVGFYQSVLQRDQRESRD